MAFHRSKEFYCKSYVGLRSMMMSKVRVASLPIAPCSLVNEEDELIVLVFLKFHLFRWYSFYLDLKCKLVILIIQNNFEIFFDESMFSYNGRFNGILTNVISNNLVFVRNFINTMFKKRGFRESLKFSEIPNP